MTNISEVDKLKVQVKLLLEIISAKLYKGLSTPDGLVVGENIHILRSLEDDLDNNDLNELLFLYKCDIDTNNLLSSVDSPHNGYCIDEEGVCQRCRIHELLDLLTVDDTHKDVWGLTEKSSRKLSRDMLKSIRDTNYKNAVFVEA